MRLADVDRNSAAALELAGEEPLPARLRIYGGPITVGQAKLWTRDQLLALTKKANVLQDLSFYLRGRATLPRSEPYPGTGERGPSWEEYCRIRDGAEEAGGEEKMGTTTVTTSIPEPIWEWRVNTFELDPPLVEECLNAGEAAGFTLWQTALYPREGTAYICLIARRLRRDPDQSPRDPTDLGAPPE